MGIRRTIYFHDHEKNPQKVLKMGGMIRFWIWDCGFGIEGMKNGAAA